MTDNEKRAHDLALLYTKLLAEQSEEPIIAQYLLANYTKSYEEFLKSFE